MLAGHIYVVHKVTTPTSLRHVKYMETVIFFIFVCAAENASPLSWTIFHRLFESALYIFTMENNRFLKQHVNHRCPEHRACLLTHEQDGWMLVICLLSFETSIFVSSYCQCENSTTDSLNRKRSGSFRFEYSKFQQRHLNKNLKHTFNGELFVLNILHYLSDNVKIIFLNRNCSDNEVVPP